MDIKEESLRLLKNQIKEYMNNKKDIIGVNIYFDPKREDGSTIKEFFMIRYSKGKLEIVNKSLCFPNINLNDFYMSIISLEDLIDSIENIFDFCRVYYFKINRNKKCIYDYTDY